MYFQNVALMNSSYLNNLNSFMEMKTTKKKKKKKKKKKQIAICRCSSRFCKKFAKLTRKHLCWSFSMKLQPCGMPATMLKVILIKKVQRRCFFVTFWKCWRAPLFAEHLLAAASEKQQIKFDKIFEKYLCWNCFSLQAWFLQKSMVHFLIKKLATLLKKLQKYFWLFWSFLLSKVSITSFSHFFLNFTVGQSLAIIDFFWIALKEKRGI